MFVKGKYRKGFENPTMTLSSTNNTSNSDNTAEQQQHNEADELKVLSPNIVDSDIWLNNFVDKHFLHKNSTAIANILEVKGNAITRIDEMESLQRMRNIVIIVLTTVFLMILLCLPLILFGVPERMFPVIIIILVMLPILWKLKYTPNPDIKLIANVTVSLHFVLILIFSVVNGIIGHVSASTILVIPAAAVAVCDFKSTQFWNVAVFGILIFVYILHKVGFKFSSNINTSPETLITLYPIAFIWVIVCLYCQSISTYFRLQQMKNLCHALEIEKDEANKSTQDIIDYVSRMSHEFRSPLHAIMNLNELALSNVPNIPEMVQYIKDSISIIESLRLLVRDVLMYARAQHSVIELNCAPVDIHELIRRLVTVCVSLNKDNKDIKIRDRIDKDIEWVIADEARLSQILFNLVSNASKFTQKGEILIDVKRINRQELNQLLHDKYITCISYIEDQNNISDHIDIVDEFDNNTNEDNKININEETTTTINNMLVLFSVSDTGIGFANNQISRIFMPFVQADSSICRKYGGTGLGLSIVNQLIKAMKGCICVWSEMNKGSKFSFVVNLPITLPPVNNNNDEAFEEKTKLINESSLSNLHILVVDDSKLNLKVSKLLFKNMGILNVTTIDNGKDAIELIKLHSNIVSSSSQSYDNTTNDSKNILLSSPIDIALIDLHMPEISGYDVAQEAAMLNKQLYKNWIPLIAYTADVNPGTYKNCQEAGFNSILTKPANKKDIKNTLLNIIPQIKSPSHWIIPISTS